MAEVLPVQPESQAYYSSATLRQSGCSQPAMFQSSSPVYTNRLLQRRGHSNTDQASSKPSSYHRPGDSISKFPHNSIGALDSDDSDSEATSSGSVDDDDIEDLDLLLPDYNTSELAETGPAPPSSPQAGFSTGDISPPTDYTPIPTPELFFKPQDDTSLKAEPSRHVDYLSHDWIEEDIWSSWKHIVSKRRIYGERSRLENASWRTWAKRKNNLRTVPADTLNWLKDCDVTWLYGPLQRAERYSISDPISEPLSNLSKNNSFLNKKPILKKRSMSEVMLQKSLSTSSLIQQAAAAVQAQQSLPATPRGRGNLDRRASDYAYSFPSKAYSREATDYFSSQSSSGLRTPADHSERKHIRFDDKVEQCIAVEIKDVDEDDEDEHWQHQEYSGDSSDDEGLMMMRAPKTNKRHTLRARNDLRRNSVENRLIAELPATTLKYRTDSPDVSDTTSHSVRGTTWRGRLSPSPSVETLRPSHPSRNFLIEDGDLDDEEEDDDEDVPIFAWPTPRSSAERRDGKPHSGETNSSSSASTPADDGRFNGLRRTESGMFMPYDDDDETGGMGSGILGKVVDTVNTARDIAHVIWNVGWRR